MALVPFEVDGKPNPLAALINCVLIDAVYNDNLSTVEQIAANTGTQMKSFARWPYHSAPGFTVIGNDHEALVAIAGTTNGTQWFFHGVGSFVPSVDPSTARFVNWSFHQAYVLLAADIGNAIGTLQGKRLKLTGHSFGAAVATIIAYRLWIEHPEIASIELQTFGSPRVYAPAPALALPLNQRIVHYLDPVQFTPPRAVVLSGLGKLISAVKLVQNLEWQHVGQAWQAGREGYITYQPVIDNFFSDFVCLEFWLPQNVNHQLAVGYMPHAARLASPLSPSWRFLGDYAGLAQPTPSIQSPYPVVSSAEESQGWFNDPSVITAETQPWWSNVSAQAYVFSGGSGMSTLMKATMMFNFDGGGFSETLWATTNGESPTSMRSKIETLLGYRAAFAESTAFNYKCNNPLLVYGYRIEDALQQRDGQTFVKNTYWGGFSYNQGFSTAINQPNISAPMAQKVTVRGADPRQIARLYLHAVPLRALDNDLVTDVGFHGFQRYDGDLTAAYQRLVFQYFDQIRALGLGLRYLNSPWDTNGKPNDMAKPVSLTMTVAPARQGYSFTMGQAFPTGQLWPPAYLVGQIYPMVVRGMKACRFLNGRKPVLITGPTSGIILGNYPTATWDSQGTISPEIWGYFTPAPSTTPLSGQFPGVHFDYIGPKKIGRPFGAPVGRRRTARV